MRMVLQRIFRGDFKRSEFSQSEQERFVKTEDGSLTILTLFLIIIIFMASGFAVDVMRYDRERAKLQYALDRAVLAAADLDQDLCPKDVVEDFLRKDGLEHYLLSDSIKVTPDVCGSTSVTIEGYRKVEASAQMNVETHFMKWSGVEAITTVATSVAEESIDDVEISLVLDVSGSMNSYNRIDNLKVAAKNFVQEMSDKTEDGKLSISIIPYATQVALPDFLMDQLSTYGENPHANCINFSEADFATMTYDFGIVRPRTMHFTYDKTYDQRPDNDIVYKEVCDRRTNREMSVLQKDPEVLKAHIESFEAQGNTSIDYGLKWGLTLLDESFRPVIANLAGTHVPAEFATRPHGYTAGKSMKVVVLMTDGNSTSDYKVNSPYRSGPSILWWNGTKEAYSTYDGNREQFYWHNVDINEWDSERGWYWVRDKWQDKPYGNDSYTVTRCTYFTNGRCYSYDYETTEERTVVDGSGNPAVSVNLTWPEVFEASTRRFIRELFREALGTSAGDSWYDNSVTRTKGYQKDPRILALCEKAKEKNIVIFSVAFEAPDGGKAILKACQSDDGAYYEATGEEIVDVFASIGSSIRNLRLTQ